MQTKKQPFLRPVLAYIFTLKCTKILSKTPCPVASSYFSLVTLMKSKRHCDDYYDFFFLVRVKEFVPGVSFGKIPTAVGTQINLTQLVFTLPHSHWGSLILVPQKRHHPLHLSCGKAMPVFIDVFLCGFFFLPREMKKQPESAEIMEQETPPAAHFPKMERKRGQLT